MEKENRRSKRINSVREPRDENGRFKRVCKSAIHDDSYSQAGLIDLVSKKRIKVKSYEMLLEKEIISKNTTFICPSCVEVAEKASRNNVHEVEPITDDETSECDDDEDEANKIFVDIGEKLNGLIKNDISILKVNSELKTLADVMDYCPLRWLNDRPNELILLLTSACQIDVNTASTEKLKVLAKAIEMIYYCVNSRVVLPNHMLENLLCYSFTNCKSFLNFVGSRCPGGRYTFITNWLKEQNMEPISFPQGLVKAAFDNSQKVGKTYLISENNTVPTSIITSHLWMILDQENLMQEDISYKPDKWMWNLRDSSMRKEVTGRLTITGDIFRSSRDDFIKESIATVLKQHNFKQSSDSIDLLLKERAEIENEKRCLKCGCESDPSFRICRNCGGNVAKLSQPKIPSDLCDYKPNPYCSFEEFPSALPEVEFKTGEPDFIDPNGYENVIQVLKAIGIRSGIRKYGKGTREWLLVECDGAPYNIIRDIIEHVWNCSKCNRCFYRVENFKEHKCFVLHKVDPVREFDWLVPVMGLLHLEMNIAKSFMKLNWEVFNKQFGFLLGFKSPKAQEYLKKGADHHKVWHFYEILYNSLSLELVLPYVRECISSETRPTSNGYWEWNTEIDDPNYIYMQQTVFCYLHAMMMLRAGVRKCNHTLTEASMTQLSHLIYSRSHPIYQNILYQNTFDQVVMPDDLRRVMRDYLSASRTQTLNKCQGGDATLEEVNKEAKSWLKKAGVPSEAQWLQVFRNLDALTKLKRDSIDPKERKENHLELLSYSRKNAVQIAQVRSYVREQSYLLNPKSRREHTNIDKSKILSTDLVALPSIAKENISQYIDAKMTNQDPNISVVYVTQEEEIEAQQLINKTKSELTVIMFEYIENLNPQNQILQEEIYEKTVKNKKKKVLIDFIYTLQSLVEKETINEALETEEID